MTNDPVAAWASSGAMWLSRDVEGIPQCAPGTPAARVATALEELELGALSATILSERAAIAGLGPASATSCGRATRILRSNDGHVALSLARPDDPDLVAALIGTEVTGDPWAAAAGWLAMQASAEAVARAQLLGLAAATVDRPGAPPDEQSIARGGVVPILTTNGSLRTHRREQPLVIDLSSLWAGPLCAHLLGLRGARVVKVEGAARPDGARRGPVGFYELLHAGHQSVSLDLNSATQVEHLRRMIRQADLVIEASRPRALAHLGIDAREVVENGTTWLSITAYGRTGPWDNRVGFGDDIAACAGMVARGGNGITFLGDALADPMTGVIAALAATSSMAQDRAQLLDVSMRDVVASTLGPVPDHEVRQVGPDMWETISTSGRHPVLPPRTPPPRGSTTTAPASGADNARWLGER